MCVADSAAQQARGRDDKKVQFVLSPEEKGSQPQLGVGTVVTLRGLKSRQELNGTCATIIKLK